MLKKPINSANIIEFHVNADIAQVTSGNGFPPYLSALRSLRLWIFFITFTFFLAATVIMM